MARRSLAIALVLLFVLATASIAFAGDTDPDATTTTTATAPPETTTTAPPETTTTTAPPTTTTTTTQPPSTTTTTEPPPEPPATPETGIVLEPQILDEEVEVGTVVGELSLIDAEAGQSYLLVTGEGDTHNHLFAIDGTTVVTAAALDYEALGGELSIRIAATDTETGTTVEHVVVVALNDVGEISLFPSQIEENLEPGSYIGTLAVEGADEGATFDFSLVTGAGDLHNDLFIIDGSDLLTATELDFESLGPSLSVRVAAADPATGEVLYEDRLFIVLTDFEFELTAAEQEILGALRPVCDPYGEEFVLWRFPQLDEKTAFSNTFGDDREGGLRKHRGADLMGAKWMPVVAAADGVVTYVGTGEKAGHFVIVTHAEGWQTWYMHLNNDTVDTDDGLLSREQALAPGVTVGADVVAGQLLGWVGDSGNAENSPPHTHFELWRSGHLADPTACLRQAWGWQLAIWNLDERIL